MEAVGMLSPVEPKFQKTWRLRLRIRLKAQQQQRGQWCLQLQLQALHRKGTEPFSQGKAVLYIMYFFTFGDSFCITSIKIVGNREGFDGFFFNIGGIYALGH